jgi:SsrA-binding protein
MEIKVVATNRKAAFEYFLLERYEAGISLKGSEIKSIRAGQISLAEAYVNIDGREAWLMDAHVAPYDHSGVFNHEPRRPRRLLLHHDEIRSLWNDVRKKGVTIVPTRVYIKDGRAKVEIAVAKGKKLYDKRETIARRDAQRDAQRDARSEIERQTRRRD